MKKLLFLLLPIIYFSGNCYTEENVIEVDGSLKVGQKVEEREVYIVLLLMKDKFLNFRIFNSKTLTWVQLARNKIL